MFQSYFHITSRCFIHVWGTFEEQLEDKFAGFMNGGGIGAVSKSYNVSVKCVAKYRVPITIPSVAKVIGAD